MLFRSVRLLGRARGRRAQAAGAFLYLCPFEGVFVADVLSVSKIEDDLGLHDLVSRWAHGSGGERDRRE